MKGSTMFTKAFWKAVAERAIKSFGQGFVVVFGISYASDLAELSSRVELAAIGGLGVALLSVATSLASSTIGNDGPSLGGEVLDQPPVD